MGQDNRKTLLSTSQAYFRQQLALYRWRADPSSNTHLARVTFSSKQRLEGRNKLQVLLQTQLQQQNYIHVQELTSLAQQELWNDSEEVMSFQQYPITLESLKGQLSLEQMLYVLQVLLAGNQQVFYKMGKVHVQVDCCFLNEKGEVRVWLNPNPVLNQFPDNCDLQLSEASAVNQILRISRKLVKESKHFSIFHQQLNSHLQRDLQPQSQDRLHHTGFSELRKFVNGFVYHHRLALPQNLQKTTKKVRQKSISLQATPHNTVRSGHLPRQSSLSDLVEPDPDYQSRLLYSNSRLPKGKTSAEWYVSDREDETVQEIDFYGPQQTHQKKLSTLDFDGFKQGKKSLNRSEARIKPSGELSGISSFSKKQQMCEANACQLTSPKNIDRTKTGLESTSGGESFLCHSKDPSGLTVSRLGQSTSTTNFVEPKNPNPQPQCQKGSSVFYPPNNPLKPFLSQNHSKQPSFDENSSSLFVSPASEMVHHQNNPSYRQPDLSRIEAISESEQSEHSENIPPRLSTRCQMAPSQLLTRQVSGLVENQDIDMYQSKGSFLSYENSISSEYKGVLMGLCRSAKLVNIPTRKNIEKRNSRRHSRAIHFN